MDILWKFPSLMSIMKTSGFSARAWKLLRAAPYMSDCVAKHASQFRDFGSIFEYPQCRYVDDEDSFDLHLHVHLFIEHRLFFITCQSPRIPPQKATSINLHQTHVGIFCLR